MHSRIVIRAVSAVTMTLAGTGLSFGLAAQGLTARVAPELVGYRWGGSVGLEDAEMLGGSATLGFGRYVLLRAGYGVAGSVPTTLTGSGYGGGTAEENSVRASFLSTGVQLRLGNQRIAPLLVGGGGVLGFTPDGRDRVQQVAVSYGAGVNARFTDWLDGQVVARRMRFRLDRSMIAGNSGGAPPADPGRDDVRSTTALSASLGARVGGARRSGSADQLDSDVSSALSGGDGLMIPIEAHAGVVRFADAFDIGDQSMAGLRAGLDFGPYFGLRGSYARGVASGLSSLSAMSTWTGEAQFNIGRVTGVSPHLLLGFGQMTFWDDFVDQSGFRPDDRDVLILGAGLGIPISDRSRFIVSLRDYVTSAGSPGSVSSTSDLRHSFGLSTGLSLDLRGRRARLGGAQTARPTPFEDQVAQAPPADTVPSAGTPPAPGAIVAERPPTAQDTARAPAVATPPDSVAGAAPTPTTPAVTPTPPAVPVDSAAAPAASPTATTAPPQATVAAGFQSDRVISLPIPAQGELYIRYGPPPTQSTATPGIPVFVAPQTSAAVAVPSGAVATDSAAIATLVRNELAGTLGAETRLTPADLAALETRLTERLTASLQTLEQSRRVDSVSVASAVRTELGRARPDTAAVVTRADLEAMEARIAERALELRSDTTVVTRADLEAMEARIAERALELRSDTTTVVTRADLQAMENRIAEQVARALAARDTQAVAVPVTRATDPEIEALSRQVAELTQMLRTRQEPTTPQTPVIVAVDETGDDVLLVNQPSGPFFRGAALRAGTHSVRDSGRGIGASGDMMISSLFSGRLRPFVGAQIGRSGVRGGIGAAAYTGHVISYGGHAGVSLDLPSIGSFGPSVSAGLAGIGGGVSGNSPAEKDIIESLYGGFVMGPRVSLDAAWTRSEESRWSVTSSLARTWAGARGGWTFQVGMRWLRRGHANEIHPLFRAPPRSEPTQQELAELPVQQETPAAAPPEVPQAAAGAVPSGQPAAGDSLVMARLDELQRALDEERQARLRTEAVADSLERNARVARERADSLARVNAEAARVERERTAAAAERQRFIGELSGLVGVVEGVQAVRSSDRGLEVILGGSLFPTGSGQLTPASRARVERVARVLARAEGQAFLVDGHTDSTGPEESNLTLSRQRADAVRAVLMAVGIAPDRIGVLASGESAPIAGNDTAEGRALNRRVEIVIVDY